MALSGASASYIVGANAAFITDDATISDVLEEMYHAKQDRAKMFGSDLTLEVTRRNLEEYEKQLAKRGTYNE